MGDIDKTIREIDADKTVRENSCLSGISENQNEINGSFSFNGYNILGQLPSGGEADIYKIEKNNEIRILKLYRFGVEPRVDILKNLVSFTQTNNKHLIRIFEYGFNDSMKRWFEILEFAESGSLKKFLENKNFKVEINQLLFQICEALELIHSENILHLDLKPTNILIRKTNPLDVAISDFGIASLIDPEFSKKITGIKGTPQYWAPESFTGVVGKQADYWALGIILLELITRQNLWENLDSKIIMYNLSTKQIPIPDNIPAKYRLLLKGLLTKIPEKRWSSKEVFRFLNGDSSIPVFYDSEKSCVYYKFNGREYETLKDLALAFCENEDSWALAQTYIGKGYLNNDIINKLDSEELVKFETLMQKYSDNYERLTAFISYYNSDLPFIYFSKKISNPNILIFLKKFICGKFDSAEEEIVNALINGKLFNCYKIHTLIRKCSDNQLNSVLSLYKKFENKEIEDYKKIEWFYNVLSIFFEGNEYFLPADTASDFNVKLEFIASELPLLLTRIETENFLKNNPRFSVVFLKIIKSENIFSESEIKDFFLANISPVDFNGGLFFSKTESYLMISKFIKCGIEPQSYFLLKGFEKNFSYYDKKIVLRYITSLKSGRVKWNDEDSVFIKEAAEFEIPLKSKLNNMQEEFPVFASLIIGTLLILSNNIWLSIIGGIIVGACIAKNIYDTHWFISFILSLPGPLLAYSLKNFSYSPLGSIFSSLLFASLLEKRVCIYEIYGIMSGIALFLIFKKFIPMNPYLAAAIFAACGMFVSKILFEIQKGGEILRKKLIGDILLKYNIRVREVANG
ncbi:MAG TPA: serine/threonine-protein kinase [bacterium]|nr:serine/threonine-protein kinase [bacterium]